MATALVGLAAATAAIPTNMPDGIFTPILSARSTATHRPTHTALPLREAAAAMVAMPARTIAAVTQSPLHPKHLLLRVTGDMRIRNSESYRSRPDRSVHRELEDFVDTLSGIELVLLVLALVIPVSALTPLLAILILGGRCDKCGRHHAMHVTHRETLPYDGTVTKRGRPVHKRIVTRVCRHCGHTDTIQEADH